MTVVALVALLLGGVWVFVAPFGIGLQAPSSPWTTATRNDLATGGALIVAALATLVAYGVLGLREMLARTTRGPEGERLGTGSPQPPADQPGVGG